MSLRSLLASSGMSLIPPPVETKSRPTISHRRLGTLYFIDLPGDGDVLPTSSAMPERQIIGFTATSGSPGGPPARRLNQCQCMAREGPGL